jgi:RHS repeat-associated protein
MTSGAGVSLGYDEANRVVSATPTSGGTEYYGYAPDNKRVYRLTPVAGGGWTENWTFYGAQGEKLVTNMQLAGPYEVYNPQGVQTGWSCAFQPGGQSAIWFAGKMIYDGGAMYQDRLGTNRSGGARFRPYGDEITSTGNDRVKFGTYTRDSLSGLDYADQRFYASSYGRFNTPDPYAGSGGPQSPASWNRYSYTRGDPVNSHDPHGLRDCDPAINPEDCCLPTASQLFRASALFIESGCMDPGPDPGPQPPAPPAPPGPDLHRLCEDSEVSYITTYLGSYNSPLKDSASQIVYAADAAGIDDRFIVALAGEESQYGKTQQSSPTWGLYNVFSNASHCQALYDKSDCYSVNPYGSYAQAISDVIALITGSGYFGNTTKKGQSDPLVTVEAIYDKYNRVPSADALATIYQQLVPKASVTSKVNFSRCP